ncbi:DnaT-like ssDNA-binding domain-containing protein [Ectopseudomonas oleovorans]|uniref:DnaT-like ssDNA-binding domain-containing protein n=1 Tax=Ectopseudomonas oleovorans TaxID=301 RepID=UPI0019D1F998|nr:DnaT-like ssDNA-binding domain-containing protein [Pseudomonas oleovorans]
MARIRTIKPEFWTDEKIVQLPYEARLLFIGLWNFADDDGRLFEEPERIKMQVMPGDDVDADLLIDLLVAVGLCDRYMLEGGKTALVISNFSQHQKISHKTASRIPLENSRKLQITPAMRRGIATKYGCKPGDDHAATCYYCGNPGSMRWWALRNGKPSSWVSFSGLEMDHFVSEHQGGSHGVENLVLACRECNRSKGTSHGIDFSSRNFQSAPENSGGLTHGKERKGSNNSLTPAHEPEPDHRSTAEPHGDTPFGMHLEWEPDQRALKAYATRAGIPLAAFTPEATSGFVLYHDSKGEAKTEREWVSSLVNWIKRDIANAAAAQSRTGNVRRLPARQSAVDDDDFHATGWLGGE